MPTMVIGTSCGTAFRNATRSSSSAGWNSASARPPARNQVILSISALGVMRPRRPLNVAEPGKEFGAAVHAGAPPSSFGS